MRLSILQVVSRQLEENDEHEINETERNIYETYKGLKTTSRRKGNGDKDE
jgi:hypothetical protein